jgi:hypothetical protein
MPVLTDTRLAYLRYMTKMFILDDPTSIILGRNVTVAMPGGGHDYPKVDLPAQNFRLINLSADDGISNSPNDDGEVRKFFYNMVGEWDADIQINDVWEVGDTQYSVDGLMPNNEYETRATVTAFAKDPRHG